MPKKKKRGDNVASSRSRLGNEKDNTKIPPERQAQRQELPEWAKDLPDEITIRTWEID